MSSIRPAAPLVLAVVALLSGCNTWQDRTEFAAPESRWSATQPSPAGHNDPPPPVARQYCYRTLAQVDCYNEPRPERITGYSGTYPDADSLVPATVKPTH
jgi:hypothetical protein